MKAVVWTAYGPPEVLKVAEVEEPVPSGREILVKVAVSNVFSGDCELRRFDVGFPWNVFVRVLCGVFQPRPGVRLGQEYAGEVVAVGRDVTRFKTGDRVFGAVEGLGRGTYAEYLVTSGEAATTMPENLSFEEGAVATVGGLNALHLLGAAGVTRGGPSQKVLLIGAGGSIGTLAIQMAKTFGAEVTVVDTTHKLDTLSELGADEVVDFTQKDFAALGAVHDVVIDIVGKNVPGSSLSHSLAAVKPGGCLVLGNPPFRHLLGRLWAGASSGRRVRVALASYKLAQLEILKELLATGEVVSVVDRSFQLDDVVAAHRYVETGRRIGNVVLSLAASPRSSDRGALAPSGRRRPSAAL